MHIYQNEVTIHQIDLWVFNKNKKFLKYHTDLNYVIHCILGETFKELQPSSFVSYYDKENIKIKLWSDIPLTECLQQNKTPSIISKDNYTCSVVKINKGNKFLFDSCCCTVVQTKNENKKSIERDVWVNEKEKGTEKTEEKVYINWFTSRLQGVTVHYIEKRNKEVVQVMRRTYANKGEKRTCNKTYKPKIHFGGILEVVDESKFREQCLQGIGRHKKFGFGFLNLVEKI